MSLRTVTCVVSVLQISSLGGRGFWTGAGAGAGAVRNGPGLVDDVVAGAVCGFTGGVRARSTAPRPSSVRMSIVCWPSSGASPRGAHGVPPKSAGVAIMLVPVVPSGTSTNAPDA